MAKLEIVTAQVYQGADRRYFSRKAAARSFAKAAIKRHCECEKGDGTPYGYPGNVCPYHMEDEKWVGIAERFVRIHFRIPKRVKGDEK